MREKCVGCGGSGETESHTEISPLSLPPVAVTEPEVDRSLSRPLCVRQDDRGGIDLHFKLRQSNIICWVTFNSSERESKFGNWKIQIEYIKRDFLKIFGKIKKYNPTCHRNEN